MKRGAENQLTREFGDPDVEEVSSDGPFQKADDAVLAGRRIKAMPRRLGMSPSFTGPEANGTEPASTPPPSKPVFAGFGTPSSGNSGFKFTPPASSPSFPAAKSSTSIFGTPGTPTPSPSFAPEAVAVAPTASSAAKTLFSSLSGSNPPPPPPQTSTSSLDADGTTDDTSSKYYGSLRGLNSSLLRTITSAIEADPFVDVARFISQYTNIRTDLLKKLDDDKLKIPDRSSAPSPSPSPFGGPSPTPQTPAVPLKMPAAPASFTFGNKPVTPTPPTTNGAADPPPSSKPFAFPASTSTTPKPSAFPSSTATTPAPSVFGSAPASSLFGSATSTTATASPFTATTSPSPFGSPSSVFGGASKPTTSLFGSGAGNPFGSPSPSTSGSPAPSFGFGASGGSIGNPVGFSFASPKDQAKEKVKEESKDDAEGDDDGATTEAASSQETEKVSTTEGSSSGSSGLIFGDDAPSGLDAEGEGEEDEETVYQAKSKAYRLRKESQGGWADIGTGFVRLKKHKETSARRLLLRTSGGKIQINFALYSGLKVSVSKKALTLVGHDAAGEAQTYSLRLRSEDVAKEFQAAIDKEVAEIKSS
ncbi:RanBD1 domain-containing protein [Favolaschia claudopus]|uniref:RanBD1 domain-containing protein n=1 Tax=Favolaschia claudopus TaxID=2862362 RepID=A0AAW0AAU3_9AGAR